MFVVNIKPDQCTGCGDCVDNCPVDILEVVDDIVEVVGDDCMGCDSCVEICTTGAITVQEY